MSFTAKKIPPFRVQITGGRFEGATGTAVILYDDGIYGIDLDTPMHESHRGFAAESELERTDSVELLEV